MGTSELFGLVLPGKVVLPALYLTIVFVGWTLKRALFAWLRHLASRTATQVDDILINAASWPAAIMILVWSFTAALHIMGAAVPERWAPYALTGSKAITLLALILFADRILINGFHVVAEKYETVRTSRAFGGVLVHVAVFVVGGLMLLDTFGVSITPIVASLGIGSLAVALALQPTLENVFSGFQLLIDKPIKVGHWVKLESGEDGFVHQIGWRTTWIRQGLNNMIIIPNKQLVNARVLNFNYPSPDLLFVVPMGVHYASDLEKVEKVAVEVGAEVLKRVPGADPSWTPVVRFTQFAASSIDFVVVLRAMSWGDSRLVLHEFIKAVNARFARENIVIPFPIVAVDTAQQKAVLAAAPSGERAR